MKSYNCRCEMAVVPLVLLITASATFAQSVQPNSAELKDALSPIVASGLPGTLILSGSETFSEAALLCIGALPDPKVLVILEKTDSSLAATAAVKKVLEKAEAGNASIRVIALTEKVISNTSPEDVLSRAIAESDAVCLTASRSELLHFPHRDSDFGPTSVNAELRKLIERGGVLLVGGSIVSALGSQMIPHQGVELQVGLNILPRTVIANLSNSEEPLNQLQDAIQQQPGHLGIGINQKSTVLIRGRNLVDLTAAVTLTLAECSYRPAELFRRKQITADLTQLLRAAEARRRNSDPGLPQPNSLGQTNVVELKEPTAPTEPNNIGLKSGSLVIVGGGNMPDSIVERFIQLAGGPEAHLIYLPTAVPPQDIPQQASPAFLKRTDIASVTILPQTGSAQIASEEFQRALAKATGVWFGGGRQWNFIDAYEGTGAIELFHKVLQRGGVIGGSSAGATIQGEFLVRGHPSGNFVMMAEGYERGFGFLAGTAIDQHFAQRQRFEDLESVIRKHRKLLGIGIDEGTALVVQGSSAEVIGSGSVHFLNSQQLENDTSSESRKLYRTFPAGKSLDLNSLGKVE